MKAVKVRLNTKQHNIIRVFFIISIACLLCLFLTQAYTEIPQYLSFQGKLTGPTGTVVADGNYSVAFRLYSTETEGAALWTETQTITVTDGIFSATLGTVSALDLDFDSQYWLSVQITSDTEMAPRQRLTAAGYAINTKKLETLSSDQFLRSDVDDTASGQITFQSAIVTGSLSAGNSTLTVNADTGNVGIGTTNPQKALQIVGDADILGDLAIGSEALPKNITVKGNLTVAGNQVISGDTTYAGNFAVSGDLAVNGKGSFDEIRLTGRIMQGGLGDLAEMMTIASCIFEPGNNRFSELDPKTREEALKTPQPGDIVIVDKAGGVMRSFTPFAKTVVGIVSTDPAQVLRSEKDNAVPIALSGVVPCKVTTENGPIQPGELLVSSSTPAHAMRAGDNPPAGTVIGKALTALESNQTHGLIEVLVAFK